jgi:GNAT superfamily N-acetyltransferase
MDLAIFKTELNEIQPLRSLFLQESNFQIRYNACHERNWSDSYLVTIGNVKVGYGSIKGKENINDRDTVFEFFVIPPFRKNALGVFSELITTSGATFIECQSNDFLLSSMLYEFSQNINSDVILFKDAMVTEYVVPNVLFREKKVDDVIFEHKLEPSGEYILELNNEIVATGGFMIHYNMPFADLYMEVREDYRRQGLGSFLIQELKKACYLKGRVPAARTGIQNMASRATLIKAGLSVAGFMLVGNIKDQYISK